MDYAVEEDLGRIMQEKRERLESVKANIVTAQKRQKERYDRKHSNPEVFAVGALVLKKDFTCKKRAGGKEQPPQIQTRPKDVHPQTRKRKMTLAAVKDLNRRKQKHQNLLDKPEGLLHFACLLQGTYLLHILSHIHSCNLHRMHRFDNPCAPR